MTIATRPATPLADAPLVDWAVYYLSLGWVLTHFAPGTKGPSAKGWNTRGAWIDTEEKARQVWAEYPDHGMGLIHGPSRTVALDVDDVDASRRVFAEFGLDLDALIAAGLRVAGKEGRAKALFALPVDVALSMHKVQWKTADGVRALFELRAGLVHDCLPPSPHPDGHAYRWLAAPWQHSAMPLVPDELLHFWSEFAGFRDQIASLAPGAAAFSPALGTRHNVGMPSEGHNDVIGAFNRRHTVHEILVHFGYVRKGQHRYLAPSSTTKTPGVSILGDKVYSHHGSDILADGHAHDAFDLFRIFEHGGDLKAAVSAAAELLGLPVYGALRSDASIDVPSLILSSGGNGNGNGKYHQPRIPLAATGEPDRPEIPAELLTPPGILADIARYGLESAVRPVPIFAVQAALALGSVVCARRYVTSLRNYSSLYFMNVAKSGTGKEEAKTTIETILTAVKKRSLVGASSFSSAGAVYSALLRKPQHIAILDEFGKYMQAAAKPGESYKSEALNLMIEAFGRAHADMSTPQYSNMTQSAKHAAETEPKIISRPALTVMALTTPNTFYESLTSTRVLDGFLNRFLVVEHIGPPQPMGEWASVDVPESVIAWVQQILKPQGDLDELHRVDHLPPATVVPLTETAKRRSQSFDREMIALASQLESDGLGDMPIRTREIGLRLGLIAGLADTPDTPAVTDELLDWAFRYVRFFLEQTVRSLHDRLADSPTARYRKQVLAAIRAAGERGVTDRELHRLPVFVSIPKRDRNDAVESLQKADLIDWMMVASAGGRQRRALVALDPSATSDTTTPLLEAG